MSDQKVDFILAGEKAVPRWEGGVIGLRWWLTDRLVSVYIETFAGRGWDGSYWETPERNSRHTCYCMASISLWPIKSITWNKSLINSKLVEKIKLDSFVDKIYLHSSEAFFMGYKHARKFQFYHFRKLPMDLLFLLASTLFQFYEFSKLRKWCWHKVFRRETARHLTSKSFIIEQNKLKCRM